MDKEVAEAVMNSKLFSRKRRPVSESDFGDDATVGLHVKKNGWNNAAVDAHVFGIYLGQHGDVFIIATMSTMELVPSALAKYRSLEELKRYWILD